METEQILDRLDRIEQLLRDLTRPVYLPLDNGVDTYRIRKMAQADLAAAITKKRRQNNG